MSPRAEIRKLRDTGLFWREIGDQVVVLDGHKSEYLTLNDSGTTLWKRLVDGATRRELVEDLVHLYGINENLASADVDAFLEALATLGLLVE